MVDVHDRDQNSVDADAVAQLIRSAGRRAAPPVDAYERTLGAATDAWRSKVRRRRERRWVVGIAASALIAVIALLLVDYAPQTPVRSAARTDRLIGTVEVRTAGGAWTVLRGAAIDLHGQTGIRTQSGSLAGIVLADGGSLRLAGDTHIVLESILQSASVERQDLSRHGRRPDRSSGRSDDRRSAARSTSAHSSKCCTATMRTGCEFARVV